MVERFYVEEPSIPKDYVEKEKVFWKKGDLFIDGFLDEELVKERINTLALRENRSKVS